MALIKCKECNAEISDKAISCPKCGYPISPETFIINDFREVPKVDKSQAALPEGCFTIIAVIIVLVIWGSICNNFSNSHTEKSYNSGTLSDEDYKNKPYDQLSESEKKQAVERASDEAADDLEKEGIHIEGRNRDRK